MIKLTLAIAMAAFAIAVPEAQAGTPMMDEPIILSVHGGSGCSKRNCITTEATSGQNDIGARWGYNASGYTLYRDRLGYGLRTSRATKARR